MKAKRLIIPLSAALAAIMVAASAHAQALQDRIRGDGTFRFSYAARPGVCGDGGMTIYITDRDGSQRVTMRGNGWTTTNSRYRDEWAAECNEGPVRVALTVDDGQVISVRSYVGGQWRAASGATDLGTIPPREAGTYLLGLVQRSGSRVGNDAIFAATLADDFEAWRQLLRIARSDSAPRDVRKTAVFWLSQVAGDAATAGLKEIIDSDDDVDVRKHAVFAISQRPIDEAVPALISLVRRKDVDPRIKKQALFWLGQKDDPRALALFEEILSK
jgi:HEAT repeat protein